MKCADGASPFWFTEKLCPPIQLAEDKIYQAARAVPPGNWGNRFTDQVNPAQRISEKDDPMQTRAKEAAKKKIEVILQLRPSGEAFNVGTVDDSRQALDLVMGPGKVPEVWNIAITSSTPQRIIVSCQNGDIGVGEDFGEPKVAPPALACTPPRPKAKRVPLPDKLAG
jgi:hypothetical protein